VRHGQYLLNPSLALRVEGEWRRIYELLIPQRLAGELIDPVRWGSYVWDRNPDRESAIQALRVLIASLSAGKTVEQAYRNLREQRLQTW